MMEFIVQISGHPKVGKKTMPGLMALSPKSKGRDFRKGFLSGCPRFRGLTVTSRGGALTCFFITLISIDLQGLCSVTSKFDESVKHIDLTVSDAFGCYQLAIRNDDFIKFYLFQ